MADHLRLPRPTPLPTRRSRGARPGPLDIDGQAKQLVTVVGDLGGRYPGLFMAATPSTPDDTDGDEGDAGVQELGRTVLKFNGRAPFVTAAYEGWGMTPLGVNEARELYALSDAASRALFADLVDNYGADPQGYELQSAWRTALQNVQGIDLYDIDDRTAPDLVRPEDGEVAEVTVTLWPTSLASEPLASEEARGRLSELRQVVETLAGDDQRVAVLSEDSRPDNLRMRVSANSDVLDAVLEHPLVERVNGALVVPVTRNEIDGAPEPEEQVVPDGAPIGIIDDLVVDHPWLDGVVIAQASFPSSRHFGGYSDHGMETAGVAAYGDLTPIITGGEVPTPHPLFVARIMETDYADGRTKVMGDEVQQVEEALQWLAENNVKIVVCAFARTYADRAALTSILAAKIDELARELGLVIVLPSGNVDPGSPLDWLNGYPSHLNDEESRVADPGTAALAVTVGSVATSDTPDLTVTPQAVAIAAAKKISPFSRVGPSRASVAAGHQKPEFLAPGGNQGFDHATNLVIDDDASLGITSLILPTNGRLFGTASGTSLAAPWVAHQIARVATRYPNATPNLLRAITALSARDPEDHKLDKGILASAYGIPDVGPVLESEGSRAILVLEDVMQTNTTSILQLPIPEEFVEGQSKRRFKIALAFDPPVRRSRRDYVAGRIDFEVVAGRTLQEVQQAFRAQPTPSQRVANPNLPTFDLPNRMKLMPARTHLLANTLIARTYERPRGGWNIADETYFLVITHVPSKWTPDQVAENPAQTYAVAVEVFDQLRTTVDLHNIIRNSLRVRGRVSGGRS